MKKIDVNTTEINIIDGPGLNTFNRLKLFNLKKINNICDKSLSLCDKLTKQLFQLSSFNEKTINETINQKKNNNLDKFIIIKENRVNKSKICKFKRANSQHFLKKSFVSFEKRNNEKYSSNREEESTFLSKNSSSFNKNYKSFYKNYSEIKLIKRKENNIKQIKNKIFHKIINKKLSQNSKILKLTNKNISYNDDVINKHPKYNNFNTFVTLQKSRKKIINHKIKNENEQTNLIIYSYKSALKKYTNEKLLNIMNKSKSLYNRQIHKLNNKNSNSLYSGRKNSWKIKNLLKKFEINKNSENGIEYDEINEDIDNKNVYKKMKLFSKNFKEKIILNKGDITRNTMITKKVADMINYCDYLFKKDEINFYKNSKSFISNYSILSKITRKEPFKKEYKNTIYKSHKNSLERNTSIIKTLINACKKSLKKKQ